jgi:hypothetical protein
MEYNHRSNGGGPKKHNGINPLFKGIAYAIPLSLICWIGVFLFILIIRLALKGG